MQPYHLPDRQQYAVEQERQRHSHALYSFGEYAVFVLMWVRQDYDKGLVGACLRCVTPRGLVADVYQQVGDTKCPDCFGTGYEGGFKARLVRPSLWDYTEDNLSASSRGDLQVATASIQTTSDFRMSNGSYVFRQDGTRWNVKTNSTNHLRTGFGASGVVDALGYNFGQAQREDEDSVAYQIPPSGVELQSLLDVEHAHYPLDFSSFDIARAPLL